MAVTPDRYGVSGAGLERARTHVEGCLERGEIAGAVIAAARRDQVVQLECVGLRDIEAGLPMTPDTIFQLASMTKLITSVGAMTLVEAGLLGLDDPVSQFVPEFRAMTVFAGVEGDHVRTEPLDRPITIEHLLTQTSGLAYDAPDPILDAAYDDFGDYDYLLPELMRRLAAYPLANQPGDAWRYGWNLDVLGRVIEVVVGQPLDQFFERKIFGPLGMVDSGFRVPSDKADRLAALYTPVDGKLERIDNDETRVVLGDGRLLQGGGSTSGGCVSTAPDYLRFSRMLLRCGELDGVRLLRAETVAEMTRNRLAPAHFPAAVDGRVTGGGYGLGFGVIVEAQRRIAGSVGTFEWGGGWNTYVRIDPVKSLIGLFLAQYEPFDWGAIGDRYWSLVCEAATD